MESRAIGKEIQEYRSENNYLIKAIEENLKMVNGTEGTPKIGPRRKLEGSMNRKYIGSGYKVGKIHPLVHIETDERSTVILDRVRRWDKRGV